MVPEGACGTGTSPKRLKCCPISTDALHVADLNPTPCERCDAPTVDISLLDGDHGLTMRSCSHCDHRTWLRGGKRMPMSEVLASVATTGRRRTA
jgi:hypothetical protein